MAYVTGRCPNCGGEVQLDGSKEKGFCLHCGSPIQVHEAVARFKVEHSGSVQLAGVATDQSLVEYGERLLDTNPNEAQIKFEKALEINPNNWMAWMNLALISYSMVGMYSELYSNYIVNKSFISRDITIADTSYDIKRAYTLNGIDCAMESWRYHEHTAFCGTVTLCVYMLDFNYKLTKSGSIQVTENHYYNWLNAIERWKGYNKTSQSQLNNAFANAPESGRDYLLKIRDRLFEYPKSFFTKLTEADELARRKKDGLCIYCKAKLGLFTKKCKSCGKSQ